MDLTTATAGLTSGSASNGVIGSVDLSVLASVQNLQSVLTSELFGSIGIGTAIDAFA